MDDNPSDALLVREYLTRQAAGVEILEAASCNDARDLCAAQEFDCVLMDQRLPGLQGSVCVKQLRDDGFLRGFVLLTGAADPANAVEAIKNGADAFVLKDEAREKLLPAIYSAIEAHAPDVAAMAAKGRQEERFDRLSRDIQRVVRALEAEGRNEPLVRALQTIEAMAPDIKSQIADIAALKTQMTNIQTSTNTSLDMLVKMQNGWQDFLLKTQRQQQAVKRDLLKRLVVVLLALIATAEAVAIAWIYYGNR